VVEGARLESVYTSKGYRGFESLSLRNLLFNLALTHYVAIFLFIGGVKKGAIFGGLVKNPFRILSLISFLTIKPKIQNETSTDCNYFSFNIFSQCPDSRG
jgi:hypothetical protein